MVKCPKTEEEVSQDSPTGPDRMDPTPDLTGRWGLSSREVKSLAQEGGRGTGGEDFGPTVCPKSASLRGLGKSLPLSGLRALCAM